MNSIGLDRLIEWEESLKQEVERLGLARQEIESKLQRLTRQLELVQQMRSIEEAPSVVALEAEPQPPLRIEPRTTPATVRELVHKILSDASVPLHINEIHRQFVERRYLIPGAGTPFNILAHIVNDKGFVRVARGTYALAGTVPEDQVLAKAVPARKKRKKRKSRKQHGGSANAI
jgi:hypothetical protein